MPVCSQAYASQTVMSGAAPRLGKLDASRSALLLCDIQVWGKCAGRTQRIMLTCMTSSKPAAANETLRLHLSPILTNSGFTPGQMLAGAVSGKRPGDAGAD